jgi:hypothetical protein
MQLHEHMSVPYVHEPYIYIFHLYYEQDGP